VQPAGPGRRVLVRPGAAVAGSKRDGDTDIGSTGERDLGGRRRAARILCRPRRGRGPLRFMSGSGGPGTIAAGDTGCAGPGKQRRGPAGAPAARGRCVRSGRIAHGGGCAEQHQQSQDGSGPPRAAPGKPGTMGKDLPHKRFGPHRRSETTGLARRAAGLGSGRHVSKQSDRLRRPRKQCLQGRCGPKRGEVRCVLCHASLGQGRSPAQH